MTAGFDVKGMEKLVKKLEKMQNVPIKVMDKALEEGAEIVKKEEIKIVKSTHDKYSEQVGWKEIKAFNVKARRSGSKIIQIGVRGSQSNKNKSSKKGKGKGARTTHWDKIRGLINSPLIQKCILNNLSNSVKLFNEICTKH